MACNFNCRIEIGGLLLKVTGSHVYIHRERVDISKRCNKETLLLQTASKSDMLAVSS